MKNFLKISSTVLVSTFVLLGASSSVLAYTPIVGQLDLGQRSVDVTSLQTFFADNSSIYPEGLVTGYFGGLTKASVLRFQALYGFDQVGRVGPVTREKINTLISAGGWSVSDVSGPGFYNVAMNYSNNSATFTFNTSENTIARVSYNVSPVMFNEGDANSNGFGPVGGFSASSYNNMSTSHSITVPNLQPNTVYYYTVIATDAAGNVSVVGPNNSFRTSN